MPLDEDVYEFCKICDSVNKCSFDKTGGRRGYLEFDVCGWAKINGYPVYVSKNSVEFSGIKYDRKNIDLIIKAVEEIKKRFKL